jgi:hypothetical protein
LRKLPLGLHISRRLRARLQAFRLRLLPNFFPCEDIHNIFKPSARVLSPRPLSLDICLKTTSSPKNN